MLNVNLLLCSEVIAPLDFVLQTFRIIEVHQFG